MINVSKFIGFHATHMFKNSYRSRFQEALEQKLQVFINDKLCGK